MVKTYDLASFVRKHRRTLVVGAIVLVALLLFTITYTVITRPERSVASFCKVAKDNKETLRKGADYQKDVEVYGRLEAVSPDDIRPDVTYIRKGYETALTSPKDALGAGIGIMPSITKLSDYINKNCVDFSR